MATYAVGDPHGCYAAFRRLLKCIGFGAPDRIVFVGDLVNRGPQSLEMVRWAQNESRAEAILGNHDIYMLLVHQGLAGAHASDTTKQLLDSREADEMCAWLRERPFALEEEGYLAVHAGIPPGWSAADALLRAREAEAAFRGPDWRRVFGELLGNEPALWDDALAGGARIRYIVNALTRMRMCDSGTGALDFAHKHAPEEAGPDLSPWYGFHEGFGSTTVVCGHWASLGVRDLGHVVAIDSGCAWGRDLTCLRLDDRRLFSVPGGD